MHFTALVAVALAALVFAVGIALARLSAPSVTVESTPPQPVELASR
jgi:hypothetical protein